MFGRKKPEVLVAGAGPVGLFAALRLARRGVRVQIVDKEWRTGAHSYALALHADTLRLLDEVGVLGAVLEDAYRVRTVGLYEGEERRAEMRISDLAEDFSFLTVMRQDVLERVLEDALEALGVTVDWNHEVIHLLAQPDHLDVSLDKLVKSGFGYAVDHNEWIVAKSKKVEVPYVIGADGHQSRIRRALDDPFDAVGPPQHFAVFEFKTDADLQHEMRVVMDEQTTNVLWPLPEGYCRWSFQVIDAEASPYSREKDQFDLQLGAGRYPILSQDQLAAFVAERAPWFQGSVEEIKWRLLVRFEHRLARSFGNGRLWLAGDAGHMTGPVGIQSMNVGLREARDLAEILGDLIQDGGDPAQLEAYNRAREAEWRFLLGLENGLDVGPQTDPWIQQRSERLLPCLPASGDDLRFLATQLGLIASPPLAMV